MREGPNPEPARRTKARYYQTDAEDSWPGWDEQHLIAVIRSKAALDTPVPGGPNRRPRRRRPSMSTGRVQPR